MDERNSRETASTADLSCRDDVSVYRAIFIFISSIISLMIFYKYMKNAILYTVSRYPNNIIKAIKLMAAIPPPDTTLVMIMVDM